MNVIPWERKVKENGFGSIYVEGSCSKFRKEGLKQHILINSRVELRKVSNYLSN